MRINFHLSILRILCKQNRYLHISIGSVQFRRPLISATFQCQEHPTEDLCLWRNHQFRCRRRIFSRGWLENSLQVFNFWEKISTSWFHHRTFPWWIFHDYPTNKGFFWHQRDDLKNHLPIIFWKTSPSGFCVRLFGLVTSQFLVTSTWFLLKTTMIPMFVGDKSQWTSCSNPNVRCWKSYFFS